jgi:HAD superfamily hydrolase (TIGR01509 family)
MTMTTVDQDSVPTTIPLPDGCQGLVFDLDGTLLHTMHHHWMAWEQVSQEYGFKLTKETLFSMAGMPSVRIMEVLATEQGLTFDVEGAALRKQKIYASLATDTEVIPMVMETARQAKARGLPVAVATGGSKLQVKVAMESAGVDTFFDAVVTCDDVEHGKPHPETFLKAAQLIGVDPEKCTFIFVLVVTVIGSELVCVYVQVLALKMLQKVWKLSVTRNLWRQLM